MRIVERIKDAVEHTADSWQQKLLNEYNASDEPATRARKIISELVKQLDKPNQVIINDIVSLIYALASNPDPSVDLDQVVSTAEMLIHELVEPIPNPDKKLMDELLHIVVNASAHHGNQSSKIGQTIPNNPGPMSAAGVNAQSQNSMAQQPMATNPQAQSQTSATQQTTQKNTQSVAQTPAAESPKATSAPSSGGKSIDNTMVKLIMDEMKEVIKKNQITEQRITDVENRMAGRITTVGDDLQTIKDKIKKQEADLETINKNLDKFISLYEVVINQYNPFIEHIEEPLKKKEPIAQAQVAPPQATQTVQPQVAESPRQAPANTTNTSIPTQTSSSNNPKEKKPHTDANTADELAFLIDEVKEMSESDFLANKAKTSKWIENVLDDAEFAKAYAQAANQQEATKLLLKKSFKLHTK